MSYLLNFTEVALEDIALLKKKGDKTLLKKVNKLLNELTEHPYTGTGKPEPLKYNLSGCYSRRINQEHRLVYTIDDHKITVLVLSALRHYKDK